ncbi:myb/SANT-like DNA-binding domain-containing protein 3 [Periplaneta americana]|uniref:myb/SANT-like DNA-binding domain-containing protein 3 n=1 Tax=Periplaneta americana TaxID=6978 RepID=UPI0037E80E13
MEEKGIKRGRAPNFSSYETSVLLDLIDKYKAILENKQTDGVTLKQKDYCWRKISVEFSCVPGVSERTHTNLKTAYENLKRRARRAVANEKVELYKAEGDPLGPSKLDTTDKRVLGIILSANSYCLPSPFDSDAGHATNTAIAECNPSTSRDSNERALQRLEKISNGVFLNSDEDDDDYDDVDDGKTSDEFHAGREEQPPESMREQPPVTTPKQNLRMHPLLEKRCAEETIQKTKKKQKTATATEAIASAAELQKLALQKDIELKQEMHELERKLKEEEIAFMQLKKEIAAEKLRYWKNKK